MEIFCAARLESSQRARFLALVSALEPLAQTEGLGSDVSSFVDECLNALRSESVIAPKIKDRLKSRLGGLRDESIGQALERLVRENIPTNTDAPGVIKDAYELRSQLIHNGVPADLDVDLEFEGRAVAAVIRDIYASLLKQPLAHPSAG